MTALAVLWMFTEVACGARSPLQSGEEELVGAGGSNSRPVGDTPHSATGGTLATGGVQYLAGSSGWDDAPRDGGRGVLGSGGTFGARPLACGPGSDSPCKNGGECVPSAGNTHQCLCRPGTFGEHCEFYIFQATPHCLLGSDGYIRDCPQDFIGVQTAFGTLKRITTYYQSGSIKEESTYSFLAGLETLGYPRLFRNGARQKLPHSTFKDILLSRYSLWLLGTDGRLAVTGPGRMRARRTL